MHTIHITMQRSIKEITKAITIITAMMTATNVDVVIETMI